MPEIETLHNAGTDPRRRPCRASRRTTTKRAGAVSPERPQDLQALRLKYRTAYDAYRSCVDALSKASVRGEAPSTELLKREAAALSELSDARANLLAAMRLLD